MPSTKELFGDDDSSSDDEPMQVVEGDDDDNNNNKQKDDDGDKKEDEGDDAEFDDQGAVVGLSSTTLAGSKATEETKQDELENEEEIVEDPRTLTVQNVLSSDLNHPTELFMTKLPNLVGIQTQAFDPSAYFPGVEEDEFGSANLMRWRYASESGNQRESNARLVQWEDDTWTLHVGNEALEVNLVDSSDKTTTFAGMNGYIYLSQKASHQTADDGPEKPAGTVLECVGPVDSRMILRPSSLQSDAHKSLMVGIKQKTIKRARIAEFVTEEDPEKLKEERIRAKADLEKMQLRKSGGGRRSGGGGGGGGRRPRMSRGYFEEDEEDEDFDTTNIRAMKRNMYDREDDEPDNYAAYDEDDDEEDDTFQRVRNKKQAAKKRGRFEEPENDDEDEEEVFGGGDDDDDDDDVAVNKGHKKKAAKKSLFDDDESD